MILMIEGFYDILKRFAYWSLRCP